MFCNKTNIRLENHDEVRECVKSLISEKRFAHTLGVEAEAEKLAEIFECGDELAGKLKSAALLHDITKEFDREKQLEICAKYKIKLSGHDMSTEKEWHAKTAAYVARHEFCADNIVFNAVYYHTFGHSKDFTLSEKIIYLADYIEAGRTYQECINVREYFYSNIAGAHNTAEKYDVLDKTVLFSFDETIRALLDEGAFIHKNTLKCRNSFVLKAQTGNQSGRKL
jgi:nicotinate-nucleotide adenylyltransferase